MEEEMVNTAVDGICDTIVGDIWFEIADLMTEDSDTDGIHKTLVTSVRKAIKKGIEIGRKL